MSAELEKVAVVGAGLMGHGIAQVFLSGGHKVALYDPDSSALAQAERNIGDIFSLLEEDPKYLMNLSIHSDLTSAAQDADLVVEAGPEKLEVKRSIFGQLIEATKPTAILATNTSAIPISNITEGLAHPERIIGAHFWNPPHLVSLVEVVESERAAKENVERVIGTLKNLGMNPVHVKRDIPGLIGNRLQHAMKREAIALVAEGVCDAETVDTVVKHGFGSRLAVLGPLEQSDLVGLNLTLDIYKTLFPTLNNESQPPKLLVDKVAAGNLGMKTGKGFREWSPEGAQKVRDDLAQYLIEQKKARKPD